MKIFDKEKKGYEKTMDWIYDSRNVSGSSTNKFNIKPAEYGEKIKLALYYKGKKIGKDSCDYNDEVWYSNRVTEGMTQKQVAEKLQISDRTVSKWERGVSLR